MVNMHAPAKAVNLLQTPPGSPRQFTWYSFRICFLVALGPLAFGYSSSIIGSTLGQPSFRLYMQLVDPKTFEPTKNAPQLEGAMSSMFFAGAVCGVLGSSYVLDKWGRRTGILCCSLFSILGSVMCCAAQDPGMFIAFRFISGLGANAFVPVCGVYSSELAPPSLRGFFGGLNGVMILLGYSLASYMGLAFFHASDPVVQWRAPLGLALVPPTLMLLLLPILPESPRWLLMQDRFEDAEKIVHKLHKGREELDSGRVEFALMQGQAEQDKTMDSSWKALFSQRANRRRAVIAMLIGILGQASGVTVINNFSPLIYSTLGFDPEETLILLCGWITGGIFASLIGNILRVANGAECTTDVCNRRMAHG
ncbi:uncharacterized protein LTR77_005129 [Saxophila tyrrhenica]|uniref:Major facilitator superfamily (MFS) profile domain-containing protein n=1 Tax=Saxophila tyrrhenica TaxID=1690608 RepID=A0AAV9PB54_9PEZI|nr:hypothetical protein LTR77_005129 [Saxophila tyrrhenica]